MSGSGSVEFEPPLACVRRLLKHALPTSTNVGKDASSAFARACGIFVIYITTCANDFARENRRQTITANDVMASAKELGFEEFIPQLTSFLNQHRSEEQSKKDAKKAADAKRSREKSSQMETSASKRQKMANMTSTSPPSSPLSRLEEKSAELENAGTEEEEEDDDDDEEEEEEDDDDDDDDDEEEAGSMVEGRELDTNANSAKIEQQESDGDEDDDDEV